MSRRRVALDLSAAEADALLSFALEGQADAEVGEREIHPSTWAAGARAIDQLRQALG